MAMRSALRTSNLMKVRQSVRFYAEPARNAEEQAKSTLGTIKEKVGQAMESVTGAFKEEGPVGKQFSPEGSVGGTAEKVGGPFDKEGKIGKQFTKEGSVGGTVQEAAESAQNKAKKTAGEGQAQRHS